MKQKYALQELEAMKTLAVGQDDDLKIDTGTKRIWLSRCTVEDGEPYTHKVTVEYFIDDQWEIWETYQAKNSALQDALDLQRRIVLRRAGFPPGETLSCLLQQALDAYLATYADWYRSRYGEHGVPRGATVREEMTQEEERTLAIWEHIVREYKKV